MVGFGKKPIVVLTYKENVFWGTNLFFQALRKFNQQTFRKSLTKNAAQATRKEKLYQQLFFGKESLTKETRFSFSTGFLL